ncbi:nectin-1-like isoform X2 [Anabas testudineus]|uniref:nectin-1-like isoform X2 n=1 Tax=Anabas testudineus TaxID=64144 RepID=UPI000E4603D0|nr:nectin-1-like isoform X2 [Anabas testudineus]
MTNSSVLYLLLMLGFFTKDVRLTSVVQTHQTVMAAVGEEAHFSCQLMDSKDVLQVTWQKILTEGEKNMAKYNKHYGQLVNSDFRDKVKFKDVGLKNCSIVIRNITEQDEGCYLCLFDCYPDGALTGRTCLQLYELHEPIPHVRESNSPEESVVSCSVTGRPAPTVTLTVSQQHLNLSHYNTVTVNNTNATVTVTTTAVLSGFRGDSIQVGCAVRVLSGPQKEVFVMIPEVKATSADGSEEESESENRDFRNRSVSLTVFVIFGSSLVVIVLFFIRTRTTLNNQENIQVKAEEEQSTPLDTEGNDQTISEEGTRTPANCQDNNLRKGTSPQQKESWSQAGEQSNEETPMKNENRHKNNNNTATQKRLNFDQCDTKD